MMLHMKNRRKQDTFESVDRCIGNVKFDVKSTKYVCSYSHYSNDEKAQSILCSISIDEKHVVLPVKKIKHFD